MSETAANRKSFFGRYQHGVDPKRRVQIPAKWQLSDLNGEFTLIFWPKHKAGACIRVMPPEKMAAMQADLDAMPNSDPQKTVLKRIIGTSATQVTVDKGGRICIPEEMAQKAGIKDQAILAGLMDRFEIWSPERWTAAEEMDAQDIPRAFELME